MIRIAIDAMGGDFAPAAIVGGCVKALSQEGDVFLYLVGDKEKILGCLKGQDYDGKRLEIVHASEVIGADEHPAFAIKKKRDSSIVVAQRLVREGKADAFVSAGSTGAVLVGGQILIGRIPGVERPALGPIVPNLQGGSLLIDCGANVDAKPSSLAQFAQMGSIYMKECMGVASPRVGILNIGTEESKGNNLVREAYPLLAALPDINFIGSVEARDLALGGADVIVTDAFAGNVGLKVFEGTAKALMSIMKETLTKNIKTKIGAALVYPDLKEKIAVFDASNHGGAPLLGLKGLVVKAHGNSKEKEFALAISEAADFMRKDIIGKIREAVGRDKQDTPARQEDQAEAGAAQTSSDQAEKEQAMKEEGQRHE